MNKGMVVFLSGRFLQILSFLLLLPLALSFAFQEGWAMQRGFLGAIVLTLLTGTLLALFKGQRQDYGVREGIVVTALAWLLASLFGALPFYISGSIPSLIDAVFETTSGFTTTGSSILTDIEGMARSMLFWRSFAHFLGGMGIIVFMLAILPSSSPQTLHLMNSEMSGSDDKQIQSRVRDSARSFYRVYGSMTIGLIVILRLAGMNWFDAFIHGFGAAGTGGFSNYADSVAHFNSSLIELILGIAMVAFSVNFGLYILVLSGRGRQVLKNPELRTFLFIVLGASLILALGAGIGPIQAFFVVSTMISTTGYGLIDYTTWLPILQFIILILMFMGGCGGSTAGGFKVGRLLMLSKMAAANVRQAQNPNRVVPVTLGGQKISKERQLAAAAFMLVYGLFFVLTMAVLSLEGLDFTLTFSAVLAILNNVGPGLAEVGPIGNFAFFSPLSKLTMILAMIAGRLEIFPLMILLLPSTWTRL